MSESFGQWLRGRREALNATQDQFALAIGVTRQAVSKWEKGESLPWTGHYKPLSKALDVDVSEVSSRAALPPVKPGSPDVLSGLSAQVYAAAEMKTEHEIARSVGAGLASVRYALRNLKARGYLLSRWSRVEGVQP